MVGEFLVTLVAQVAQEQVPVPIHAMYVGPETIIPLTSILGMLAGAIMIFWRSLMGVAKRLFRVVTRRGEG
jgi:hypothetical protein